MAGINPVAPLELWGGVECTVNRVGDRYRDQTRLTGHHDRIEDLDRFADLGLSALRYPVLWERTDPEQAADWRWPDERLGRLRQHGIRPIVGLVHHGSGPLDTHLCDDGFAAMLGRFAGAVAERYPWIDEWTPINEPLTTARFSALYGHWYPHARDERSFWQALLNQIDGIRTAMAAIRRVNPHARLIQTDDLGRTYATPPLQDQADHDNVRRWAGWDLLFGHVDAHHPLFELLDRLGFGDRLRAIADAPCPPDVIGINHYLTSDRLLDHRIDLYPAQLHGGNGRSRYADTEAIRALDPPPVGLAGALREGWERYGAPLAITEVHNGCTREEQMRWAAQAWDAAVEARRTGVDVRAVTAWALLGSQGWNTLLTDDGAYEAGVWDVSGGTPRPTALARLWQGLPGDAPRHPVAVSAGWWQRPTRLLYGEHAVPAAPAISETSPTTPLLIAGATGTLGQAFARACDARGIVHVSARRSMLDLEIDGSIAPLLDALRPWAVVNATGWVRVDDAEASADACQRINTHGAIALAQACAARGVACLSVSSDLVFAGDGTRPLVERDPPQPLNVYGRSKAALEAGCAHLPGSLVVRTAAFFSPHDRYNFAAAVAATLEQGRRFDAADDHVVTPTFVPALVDAALDLLIDGEEGIWHLSNGEAVSWVGFARRVAEACGYDPEAVRAVPGAQLGWLAPRPRFVPLASERGNLRVSLDQAIARFAHERAARSMAAIA